MKFPWVLSLSVGFLSLSQEILWVRYIAFAYQSVPQAFSFVLMVYLLGIASGALVAKRLCARAQRLCSTCGAVLIGAAGLGHAGADAQC